MKTSSTEYYGLVIFFRVGIKIAKKINGFLRRPYEEREVVNAGEDSSLRKRLWEIDGVSCLDFY